MQSVECLSDLGRCTRAYQRQHQQPVFQDPGDGIKQPVVPGPLKRI